MCLVSISACDMAKTLNNSGHFYKPYREATNQDHSSDFILNNAVYVVMLFFILGTRLSYVAHRSPSRVILHRRTLKQRLLLLSNAYNLSFPWLIY